MKSPHSLAELKFSSELSAFSGSLEIDGDYDRILFEGCAFDDDADARGARFAESAFVSSAFDGGPRRSRLSDVWFDQTRLVAVDMAETSLTDTWFNGCVLAGVQAFSSIGRRVVLRGCKLDSVNFRDCKLTDAIFEDCVLRDVDFGSARLTRVRFPGSVLSGVDLTRVTCKDVDLRGARLGTAEVPGIKAGYDSLDGAVIDTLQLMSLAPLLAQHLGLRVSDG